jgi:hypothetical protein
MSWCRRGDSEPGRLVQTPALSPTNDMAWGKTPVPSGPQFPHLESGDSRPGSPCEG